MSDSIGKQEELRHGIRILGLLGSQIRKGRRDRLFDRSAERSADVFRRLDIRQVGFRIPVDRNRLRAIRARRMGFPRRRDARDRFMRAEERDGPYGIEEKVRSGSRLRPVPGPEHARREIPSGMLRRDDPRRRDLRHDRVYRKKRRFAHYTLRMRLT